MNLPRDVRVEFRQDITCFTSGGEMSWKAGDREDAVLMGNRIEIDWGCGQIACLWLWEDKVRILFPLEQLAEQAE